MGRQIGSRDNYERKRTGYNPDLESYTGADSGCLDATTLLGYQSCCLTNCPFKRCKMEDIKENKSRKMRLE